MKKARKGPEDPSTGDARHHARQQRRLIRNRDEREDERQLRNIRNLEDLRVFEDLGPEALRK